MVRYVKNEGRPALGFAVESEESDESSDDEPLSDQPSLATLVSENPGSPPDSQAPFVPKSERRRSASRVSFKEDMAFVDRQGYTRDSENLEETVVKVRPLGHGQFGRVWLAFHAPTQRLVALKEVEAQTEKRRKRAVAEISANARQAAPFERRATPTDSHGSPEVSEDVAAWRRDLVAGAVHGCDHVRYGVLTRRRRRVGAVATTHASTASRSRRRRDTRSRGRWRRGGAGEARIAATHELSRRRRPASHTSQTQVLKFFGSFADPRGETVSLVIEFMDAGSLDQFMGADALSCPKFLQRAAVGALRGLGHLHAHRVVHRFYLCPPFRRFDGERLHTGDVKPANVLLSRRGDVKVGDLGDAVPEQDEDTNVSTSTPVTLGTEGTLAFFAPERAAGACYGCAADAWALGVTLVAVWTGRLPLVPGNGGLFAFAALVCDSAPPSLDASAPSEALKLVEKLCTKDANVRPSCASLLNEDGFVKAYDWDRGFGDYWAEALRWAPLDGREILEAVSTAVGFATVRAERKQAPRRSQSAPNLMPRRPEPKRRKSFLSITASAAKTLVRRISRRKSKKKAKASEPLAHLASATPTSPLTPTRSPRSPISYVLSAATARLRAKANAKALRDAELYASVGAEESLERDAQRRREEAMQRRRAEKPDLLAAQLAIRQSHRNRRIGDSEWVSTAAAVSVDSPVRRHFRGRRGGHGAGGHHDTGWGSQMRRSPTNRASQSSSSGSSQRGPPTRRSADSGRGSFATLHGLPPTRRSGDTGRGTLSSDERATMSSNGTVRRAAATPPTRRSADSGVTFGSMDGSNAGGPQEQNSLATLGTTFSKFSVSGVLEGSTADTTLDSVLDQDKLNDTYAIAQELGVGVLEVYDAMTRGEERAAEALDREASRGYDPGDGEDSPPRSSMMRRARSSYTV